MKLNNNDDSHNSGLNLLIYNMLLDIESHPTWVCGLKQSVQGEVCSLLWSHPTWVCGLKQWFGHPWSAYILSHPTWVCGLKHMMLLCMMNLLTVTPYVGVWIETSEL